MEAFVEVRPVLALCPCIGHLPYSSETTGSGTSMQASARSQHTGLGGQGPRAVAREARRREKGVRVSSIALLFS